MKKPFLTHRSLLASIVVVAGIVVAFLIFRPSSHAIFFAITRGGEKIYRLDADAKQISPVADFSKIEGIHQLKISFDTRYVARFTKAGLGLDKFHVVDLESNTSTSINTPDPEIAKVLYPIAWSPAKPQLLVGGMSDAENLNIVQSLWLYDAPAKTLRRIDNNLQASFLVSPTWSPDGRFLAVVAIQDCEADLIKRERCEKIFGDHRYPNLYVLDLEQNNIQNALDISSFNDLGEVRLTGDLEEQICNLMWSPSSIYIAFEIGCSATGDVLPQVFDEIFLLNTSSKQVRRLTYYTVTNENERASGYTIASSIYHLAWKSKEDALMINWTRSLWYSFKSQSHPESVDIKSGFDVLDIPSNAKKSFLIRDTYRYIRTIYLSPNNSYLAWIESDAVHEPSLIVAKLQYQPTVEAVPIFKESSSIHNIWGWSSDSQYFAYQIKEKDQYTDWFFGTSSFRKENITNFYGFPKAEVILKGLWFQ